MLTNTMCSFPLPRHTSNLRVFPSLTRPEEKSSQHLPTRTSLYRTCLVPSPPSSVRIPTERPSVGPHPLLFRKSRYGQTCLETSKDFTRSYPGPSRPVLPPHYTQPSTISLCSGCQKVVHCLLTPFHFCFLRRR